MLTRWRGTLAQRGPRALDSLLDLLFPPRCAACRVCGASLCPECTAAVVRIRGRLCSWCGEPMSGAACARCRTAPLPLPVRSYGRYAMTLVPAILRLKYRPDPHLANLFAGWLEELCRSAEWSPTLIVPVPLAQARERQRGYNQVALLARLLADRLDCRFTCEGLARIRATRSQVGLGPAERMRNVRGAFQARENEVRGQVVCLVDDLLTTGATLAACAEALLSAQALDVFGLTVGRAGPYRHISVEDSHASRSRHQRAQSRVE
jgi:ComF family protein